MNGYPRFGWVGIVRFRQWWVLKNTSRWSVGLRHLNKIVQTVVGADRRDAPLKEIRLLRRVHLGDPHLLHFHKESGASAIHTGNF